MKKFLGILLAVMVLSMAVFAADITVTLNGDTVDCESYGSPATIVEGRTLVPLRAIFEALGASVEWDQATRTVSSTLGEDSISLAVGSTTLVKNGENVTLDVPAQIINDRTMVPARAIAEAYGVGVEWDAATRTVILTQEVNEGTAPVVDENVMVALSGESYTGNENFLFTCSEAILPEVVANPDNADDKVLFLDTQKTDGPGWTYFRDNTVSYEPGTKYITYFKFMIEKNALDLDVPEAIFGVCFRYADSTEDGDVKDHGVAQIKAVPGEWNDVAVVFTTPETLIEGDCGFGLFCNPVDNVAISYYLDDVTLAPYDGAAEDGIHSATTLKAADEKEAFDINTAKGLVYNMDADNDEFMFSGCSYEYKDGQVIMTADGETQIDPIMNFKDPSIFTADKYSAVAVRFKAEGVAENQRHIAVYFATVADDALSQSKCISIDYDDLEVDSEGYYVAFVQMETNLSWDGQLTALRVDPGNSGGVYTIDKIIVVEK